MSTIYLIRHGQASFAADDYDQLSDLGYRQAHVLGESFQRRGIIPSQIVRGSMLRHQQTAESFFGENRTGVDCLINNGWNEYDFKNILQCWAQEQNIKQPIDQFLQQQSDVNAAFEAFFNDAVAAWMRAESDDRYCESWSDFKSRIGSAFAALCDNLKRNEVVFVFTSGGPIAYLSQTLLGVAEQKLMALNWTLVNAGYSKIVVSGKRKFLSSLNVHSHFEALSNEFISYR